MNLVEKAKAFATQKHGEIDHRRKYTNEPYINHPAAVVEILKSSVFGVSDEMLAVAWLHDTVEDTNATYNEILDNFGMDVLIGIDWLTDKYTDKKTGNRAVRKMLECRRMIYAPNWVKTIKIADLIDNSHSILQHDSDFAKLYLTEKRALLTSLLGGDSSLYWYASRLAASRKE